MRLLLPLALLAAPAAGALPGRTAATDYVLARAADAQGDLDRAAQGYAAALAASPDDPMLQGRLYRQAVTAGDMARAVPAARALEPTGKLPSDGRLLLVADALKRREWADARRRLAAVPSADLFAFTTPVLAAWAAQGAGADPLPLLVPGRAGALALPYLAEHRGLLLLAVGRTADALAAIRAASAPGGQRGLRLRLAAAATMNPRRDAAAIDSMLTGDEPVLARARALRAAGKPLPAPVNTPAAGMAELLVRIAADLNRERISPVALPLARIAAWLAPDDAEAWLASAAMLAAAGRDDAALAALEQVAPADPFAPATRDLRVRLLVRGDKGEAALAEAQAAAALPDAGPADLARVGDLLMELDRPGPAADAYARAVAAAKGQGDAALQLSRGGALERAGRWPEARAALARAVELAPDQPTALNYLGYAMLERGEDLPGATRMIERASHLAPDDAAITDSLGWAYFRQGRIQPAIAALEKAAEGEPGDPDINEHLGDAYWAAGRHYEARYAWAAARVHAEGEASQRLQRKIEAGPPR